MADQQISAVLEKAILENTERELQPAVTSEVARFAPQKLRLAPVSTICVRASAKPIADLDSHTARLREALDTVARFTS